MLIRNLHNPSELLALIVYAIKNTKIHQGSLHILMLIANLINVKNDNRLHVDQKNANTGQFDVNMTQLLQFCSFCVWQYSENTILICCHGDCIREARRPRWRNRACQ